MENINCLQFRNTIVVFLHLARKTYFPTTGCIYTLRNCSREKLLISEIECPNFMEKLKPQLSLVSLAYHAPCSCGSILNKVSAFVSVKRNHRRNEVETFRRGQRGNDSETERLRRRILCAYASWQSGYILL